MRDGVDLPEGSRTRPSLSAGAGGGVDRSSPHDRVSRRDILADSSTNEAGCAGEYACTLQDHAAFLGWSLDSPFRSPGNVLGWSE
jgi:hypothetical protein